MLIENQMRAKMAAAVIKAKKVDHSLLKRVAANYDDNVGVKQVREWDAKLSLRTYSRLKDDGVMK